MTPDEALAREIATQLVSLVMLSPYDDAVSLMADEIDKHLARVRGERERHCAAICPSCGHEDVMINCALSAPPATERVTGATLAAWADFQDGAPPATRETSAQFRDRLIDESIRMAEPPATPTCASHSPLGDSCALPHGHPGNHKGDGAEWWSGTPAPPATRREEG